ncbi:STAS domain-containing protein [Reyranella sp.]|uniref:STAS domain-containing protein n=1 Tax=Reyranella sp. TaxID=1929291 RepID=UPI003D102D59
MTVVPKDITTITLPERMDSVTASSVEQTLQAALTRGAKIIVDGSAVVYMSAAGVRALASVLHGAEEAGARVVFCRFSGPAADCLDVSGFSQLLDVAENLEDATARLEPRFGTSASRRLHPRGAAG